MSQTPQPQLLSQLRKKSLALHTRIQTLQLSLTQKQSTHTNLLQQHKKLKQQTQIQTKKHRSLIVLLNELQQTYHNNYLEFKQQQDIDQIGLNLENQLLRFLLLRISQDVREGDKVCGIARMGNMETRGKVKQLFRKSGFVEQQAQIIAKLKSQITTLTNTNLQCKRKWYILNQQSKSLQSENSLLQIQSSRQKTEIKHQYETYLQSINEAKQKIVAYNETQKQSIITDYLVKQIAVLQQKRVEVQEEFHHLEFHFNNLEQDGQRVEVENRELRGFFGEGGEEGLLAGRMRKRIEELRDVLLELKKKNKNTRGSKLRKILQKIKQKHRNLQQSNNYIQMKTRQQQTYGSYLQQQPIAEFFSKILQQKDKTLLLMREQEASLGQKLKELQVQKQLLLNQIANLEDNLSLGNWENKFVQNDHWNNVGGTGSMGDQLGSVGSAGNRVKTGEVWGQYGNFTFDSKNF